MSTIRTYLVGFLLSALLTAGAFWVAQAHLAEGGILPAGVLAALLITLAVGQLFVQLVAFLHVGREPAPKWNLQALVFALFIVAVVVGGTMWIMNHLNHEMTDLPREGTAL